MKKISLLISVFVLFINFNADAQSEAEGGEFASRGFRITLLTSAMNVETKTTFLFSASQTNESRLDQSYGVSVGYAHLPVDRVGILMALSYLDYKLDSYAMPVARLDGNLAWTFNNVVYAKVGLNISQFTKSEQNKQAGFSFGYQAGIGFQISPSVGIEVNHVQTAQESTIFGFAGTSVRENGIESAVNLTF